MKKFIAFSSLSVFSYFIFLTSGSAVGADPVVVSSEGKKAVRDATALSDSAAQARVDSMLIAAADTMEMLDNIEIVASKRLVQSDGAKLTYNVSEDPESKTSNFLDMLKKVPGVTVDADDNVKVNGQSNFKILMNGHDDPMLKGQDLKGVLKSIPASSIKRIEVISEPGAKYEAEGVGGILNIVTDASAKLSGMMVELSGYVNTNQAGGYVSARKKLDNVMLGATVSYGNAKSFRRKYSSRYEREDLTGGADHMLISNSKGSSGWEYVGPRLNMSWEPDTLNLFTVAVSYNNNTWDGTTSNTRTMHGLDYEPERPDESIIYRLIRESTSGGMYNGVYAQASYQHSFGRSDNNLVLSYLYGYSYYRDATCYVDEALLGEVSGLPYSRSQSRQHENTHVVQVDYSNQFGPKHLFEAGGKANIDHLRNGSQSLFGESEATAVVDERQSVDLGQFQDIYALYASYTGQFSKWNVKGGLRYEYTRMGLRYQLGDYPNFTTHLHDLVPNASVSYNFTDASTLRAAYQMRIWRPGVWVLNPYVNTLTPGEVSYGNPDLKSQKSHVVSLGYSNYEGSFSGSAKVSYRYIANGFCDIVFMKDNVMHSTYANVGKNQDVSIETNGDWSITNDLKWSVYFTATYSHYKAESEMLKAKKHGWQYNVSSNINYTLPCKLRLSAYGGFYTPWLDMQSRGKNGYYYGLSASRSFLKDDALTLSLSASNLFPVTRHSGWSQQSESVRISSRSSSKYWNVGFGITWRFGGLKANVKQTAASIESEQSAGAGGNKN